MNDKPNQVSLLELKFNIGYQDPDEGYVFVGEGSKLVGIFQSESDAQSLADQFNPIIEQAEKEDIVFPLQPNNLAIKNAFGFTLHNIDDGHCFKLAVTTHQVNPPRGSH